MITIISGVCIFQDHEILLVQNKPDHREPLKWGMPGGHGHPGETPLETAIREVKEETSLKLEIQGLSVCGLATSTSGKEFITVLYTATPVNPESITIQDTEVNAYAWASYQDIQNDIYPLREQPLLKPLILRSFTTPPAPIDTFLVANLTIDH